MFKYGAQISNWVRCVVLAGLALAEVNYRIEYNPGSLRMSVADDGTGLPEDFADRGHGFANMRADADRMGASLEVERAPSGRGTILTCILPYREIRGGANKELQCRPLDWSHTCH